jgi:putative oxygen-independent coproporphyrinogen III oxidase
MATALYIHWPFCISKCPYCDFNSHVREAVNQKQWLEAMLFDMAHEAKLTQGEPLSSIFFGGGTPSLMPPATVAALLTEAEEYWGFASDIEITLEANPSSVESARFADLAAAGVNRVSLGLQALHDAALQFLGRAHSVDESLIALAVAQQHFARVSFDLIYARPGQSMADWQAELARAIGFGTGHMSLYQLTIEPGTRFQSMVQREEFTPLDDDAAADLLELTQSMMNAAGLPAYEISNHARPGEESRHNLTYWRYQDYVGIGPGAHGRRGGMATVRHKKPENFLSAVDRNGQGLASETPLDRATQAMEALLMGLRLREGVDISALSHRFAMDSEDLLDFRAVEKLCTLGFIHKDADRVIVTPKGMPLLDAILPQIVAIEPAPADC